MKTKLHIALTVAALLALALLADAWRSARRDASQLAATLAAQETAIEAAGNREHQRDAQLAAALAAIQAQKRRVQTPEQAAAKLPSVLPPLPLPITIPALGLSLHPQAPISNSPPDIATAAIDSAPRDASAHVKFPISNLKADLPSKPSLPGALGAANSPNPSSTSEKPALSISVPQADLKPIYDDLQDCRANALESDALQKDLADEKARTAALLKERDAALTAARGGTFWRRVTRNAKWFAVGAAAGAAAAAFAHR